MQACPDAAESNARPSAAGHVLSARQGAAWRWIFPKRMVPF